MKTLLSLLAAVSVFGIAVPANAALPLFPPYAGVQPYPGARRIVSYLTNGTPVYAVYQIVGYDAMGYPIYQWVTQPVSPMYGRSYYGYNRGYRSYGYRSPIYVRPNYVRPYYGGHAGHVGHFGHSSGPVFHGGGHVSHGGGHVSHGGGGHMSHGSGGHGGGHGGGGHGGGHHH